MPRTRSRWRHSWPGASASTTSIACTLQLCPRSRHPSLDHWKICWSSTRAPAPRLPRKANGSTPERHPMLTIVAFVIALAVLIAVHEYGHYRVAVACGVLVLRFLVGFGRTILRYKPKKQRPGQDTEFVIGAFPVGGYVKMLDEREGPVSPEERHLAFNTQPLKSRAAIVAAGPIANLGLAVF